MAKKTTLTRHDRLNALLSAGTAARDCVNEVLDRPSYQNQVIELGLDQEYVVIYDALERIQKRIAQEIREGSGPNLN
ncbi:MAG TPA: hypothetical protein VGI40_05075 [Pirellulaceae bacterium]|jgi:stalled ribosome rescue protein Dom34